MTRKRSFYLFSILLLPFCSGCNPRSVDAARPKASEPPRQVQVVRPSLGEITRAITLPAEVRPFRQATLYAKVAGYLKSISVDKGDEVQQGALLAEIEVPELIADAAKYKAEVELAALEYKRVADAQKKAPDLVVPLSVDTARSKSEVAKANLERAETLLAFTRITAPFPGIITRRMVDPGAFIPAATSGAPQSAAILTISDFKAVRVQIAVPENEASRITKNQPVKLTVEGLPSRGFTGKVTRFSYALDEAAKTMLAEVELPNPDLELRPGMYATAQIGIERKENALLVPIGAVLTEKANSFIFTVSDEKAKKVPVKIGFTDGKHVELLTGAKPGQPVITSAKALNDGQAVAVVEGK
jgi:membrane fusion protein, multidrug efflux system